MKVFILILAIVALACWPGPVLAALGIALFLVMAFAGRVP